MRFCALATVIVLLVVAAEPAVKREERRVAKRSVGASIACAVLRL